MRRARNTARPGPQASSIDRGVTTRKLMLLFVPAFPMATQVDCIGIIASKLNAG
jgi:hypothetical protein